VDKCAAAIDNPDVRAAGSSRKQIARTLNAAYADGLISHDTFVQRLDLALATGLIDTRGLVGDLGFREATKGWRDLVTKLSRRIVARLPTAETRYAGEPILLALDWSGASTELLIGRHRSCDVVLGSVSVSRRHARLFHRDGNWIIQDLESMNGTLVNGAIVGRCQLQPGDQVLLGGERLQID
jgi:FHA domain/Domain of unknown function (DUF1707)